MGRDKASLMFGQETFLQRIAAELDACGFGEKYVSLGSGTAEKADIRIPGGWTVIRDRYRDCGPLGGIHAALSLCRAEWALFVSCDTPLYRRELAELMISKIPGTETEQEQEDPEHPAGTQLLVPMTPDGRWHMTCALWRKSLLPEVEAQLKSGNHRLRGVCFKDGELSPGTVLVPLEGERAAFAEMLENINTEEDYRRMVVKNCRES
jgi:molybdopterin-guanine dinucleotide biosynthesis protein A